MNSAISRRSMISTLGFLFTTTLSGCLVRFDAQQPFGDLVISNNDNRSHDVVVTAVNQHIQSREGEEAATKRFDRVIEGQSTVREEEFFVAGDTEVTVAVDGTIVEETRVEIWRGEGGDEDRHEESLNVTIRQGGDAQVSVDVTHTPS